MAAASAEETIKHRFLAADESGHQLLYVDQFDSSKDWTIKLQGNRDIQLLDDKRLLASFPGGYREYEIATGRMIKEVKVDLKGVFSARRHRNNHTYVANRSDLVELDENDKVVKKHAKLLDGSFRVMRMTPAGHFLFICKGTSIKEVGGDGETVRTLDLKKIDPKIHKCYFIDILSDGNYLVSTGSGKYVLVLDKEWKLVRKVGGPDCAPGEKLNFFAGAAMLENGNIVVTHWCGHKKKDSRKAAQLLEFDKAGKLVWKWHDSQRAGCLHGIIMLKQVKLLQNRPGMP